MGKTNIFDKIMLEKKENMEIIFYIKLPSNRWFKHGIHSLLRRADARGSAD